MRTKPPRPAAMLMRAPMRKEMATESPNSDRNIRRRKVMTTKTRQRRYSSLRKVKDACIDGYIRRSFCSQIQVEFSFAQGAYLG